VWKRFHHPGNAVRPGDIQIDGQGFDAMGLGEFPRDIRHFIFFAGFDGQFRINGPAPRSAITTLAPSAASLRATA
jgi:hypothetical protein